MNLRQFCVFKLILMFAASYNVIMQPEKLLTASLKSHPWGADLAIMMAAALAAVDPYQAVNQYLKVENQQLLVGERVYPLDEIERIYVVGAGKAGLPMAQAVVDLLGKRLSGGLVIVKDGHHEGFEQVGPVTISQAAHPLPDQRGVQATGRMLDILHSATKRDLVICVISGGGSALLTALVAGFSLVESQTLTSALLARGAAIQQINTLRKRLDQVKGGGLAQAAAPAQVVTLILSDVVGDPLDMIASGPTVPNSDTLADALAVVAQYDLAAMLPAGLYPSWQAQAKQSISPPQADFPHVHNLLVGNNQAAAQAALFVAAERGYHIRLLTDRLQGEARQVGAALATELRQMPPKSLWLAGGETTVTLQGDGIGGRNQELALAAVVPLAGLAGGALLTLATDGGDGVSPAAGAVVTGQSLARATALGLDPADYLARNDSYTFFNQLDDCILTGPTRTNVNDLVFLLRSDSL